MPIAGRFFPVICAIAACICAFFAGVPDGDRAVPVNAGMPAPIRRILLVPLDSRPPCGRFVQDAGRIAGVEVILPPPELLDEYFRPGDTAALRSWTEENLPRCDAAILSVDQLLHGGLLASRQAQNTPEEEKELLDFFRSLRAAYPHIPLYAFSILPRMTPPDGLCDWHEQQRLMAYSRLMGRISLEPSPSKGEREALEALRASIDPEILKRYEARFQDFSAFGGQLIRLAEEDVLQRLVIGQDDSEPRSIPDLVLRRFTKILENDRTGKDRVFIARGADELALSILAAAEAKQAGFAPRIAIRCNDSTTLPRVLPYMGAGMEEVALEKIRMNGGIPVACPEDADFTLYLSAHDETNRKNRPAAAAEIASLIPVTPVALVDLAVHFRDDEALLPVLMDQRVPLHGLAAYAGWNTASNSVGTAVAQAILLQVAQRRAQTETELLEIAAAHFSFLDGRFLEDYFYLKDAVDHINYSLEKCGAQNGRGLEYDYNYPVASFLLDSAMENRRARLQRSDAFRAPVAFPAPDGPLKLRAAGLTASARYPWPRTFEIDLRTNTRIERLP